MIIINVFNDVCMAPAWNYFHELEDKAGPWLFRLSLSDSFEYRKHAQCLSVFYGLTGAQILIIHPHYSSF